MRQRPIAEVHWSADGEGPVICSSQMLSGIVSLIFEAHVCVPRTRTPILEIGNGAGIPSPVQVNVQLHNTQKNDRLLGDLQTKKQKNAD
jgi:hypothetical protein